MRSGIEAFVPVLLLPGNYDNRGVDAAKSRHISTHPLNTPRFHITLLCCRLSSSHLLHFAVIIILPNLTSQHPPIVS